MTRHGRHPNSPVIREICRLACRNKSGFENVVRRILDTLIVKTIVFGRNESSFENLGRHAQATLAAKTNHFAGTNRACGDKNNFRPPKRIEAKSTR